jgi:hypothetical protein
MLRSYNMRQLAKATLAARLVVVAGLAFGCVAAGQPAGVPEPNCAVSSVIGARIKAIAAAHSGSTVVSDHGTTYYVYSLKSPRGYRAVLTFTEGPALQTVTVQLYESVRGAQQLTMLIDEMGKGTIDRSYVASAPSIADAFALIRSGRGRTVSPSDLQGIYTALLADLSRESSLRNLALK